MADEGVSAEVVDPRTLVPLDRATLVASAKRPAASSSSTRVIDFGASAELAVIAEGAFWDLEAPVTGAAAMDVPIPFSPVLEDRTVPTVERLVEVAKTLIGRGSDGLRSYGTMRVDWSSGLTSSARGALARAKAALAESELGALLCFDMNNIRYITATHIGTWAIDKLVRFASSRRPSRSCGTSARPPATTSSTTRGSGRSARARDLHAARLREGARRDAARSASSSRSGASSASRSAWT